MLLPAIRNVVIVLAVLFCTARTVGSILRASARRSTTTHSFVAKSSVDSNEDDKDYKDDEDTSTKRENDTGYKSESSMEKGVIYHLNVHKVMDSEGTGGLACSFLLPEGWTSQDRIQWFPNNYLTPVMGSSTIRSGDGAEELVTMSGLEFNFSRGPGVTSGTEPPQSASAFLLNSWKQEHPGVHCQVLESQDTPIDAQNSGGPGFRVFATHGMFKIRWSKNGSTITTKTQARLDVMETIPAPTGYGGNAYEGGWMISNLYQVSASGDRLPDAMKAAGIVLTSLKSDPQFFNKVMQARQIESQNFSGMEHQIRTTTQLISQLNDQMLASIDHQMAQSQAAQDHEATSFDDYIRGVDKYDAPDGVVDLPSGYNHAFTDGFGRYIVTDEHGYDPNVNGPGGSWTEVQKTQ